MPITYSVDHSRGITIEVWTGSITADVLGEFWARYLRDPEVMARRRTLADLRQCTIAFTGRELSALIDSVVLPVVGEQKWRTAIVAAEPVQYGVSRQYHVFAEYYSQDAIFKGYDAALNWLVQGE